MKNTSWSRNKLISFKVAFNVEAIGATTARDRRNFSEHIFIEMHSKKQSVNFTTPKSYSPRFQKSTKSKIFLFKSVFNYILIGDIFQQFQI
jgi:hypothetical protein